MTHYIFTSRASAQRYADHMERQYGGLYSVEHNEEDNQWHVTTEGDSRLEWVRRHFGPLSQVAKTITISAVLMLCCAICNGASIVTDTFLSALERAESGGKPGAVGDNGRARGSYQFHTAAWQTVNELRAARHGRCYRHYSEAYDRSVAREFAREYCQHLEQRLMAAGIKPTSGHVVAAWNLGFAGFSRRSFDLRRCPKSTRQLIRSVSCSPGGTGIAAGPMRALVSIHRLPGNRIKAGLISAHRLQKEAA